MLNNENVTIQEQIKKLLDSHSMLKEENATLYEQLKSYLNSFAMFATQEEISLNNNIQNKNVQLNNHMQNKNSPLNQQLQKFMDALGKYMSGFVDLYGLEYKNFNAESLGLFFINNNMRNIFLGVSFDANISDEEMCLMCLTMVDALKVLPGSIIKDGSDVLNKTFYFLPSSNAIKLLEKKATEMHEKAHENDLKMLNGMGFIPQVSLTCANDVKLANPNVVLNAGNNTTAPNKKWVARASAENPIDAMNKANEKNKGGSISR